MKANVFDYSSYKHYLRVVVYERGPRGELSRLAREMGCQAAYFSQVLRGKSELTEDQAFKATRVLEMSDRASEYFMALLRLQRATSPELKTHLTAQLEKLKSAQLNDGVRLDADSSAFKDEDILRYFGNWIPSTVHVATSCPAFQTIQEISRRFAIPSDEVMNVLKFLEEKSLVESRDHRWTFKGPSRHFPKSSRAHQASHSARRSQVARSIELNDPDDFHFSSVFAITREIHQKLKKDLLKYAEDSHRDIHAADSVDVYGMSLDLYRVK